MPSSSFAAIPARRCGRLKLSSSSTGSCLRSSTSCIPEAWLLPLNAAGALGLSILKWQTDAPDALWILLAAAAAVYLASAAARLRSAKWHGAATLTATLAAGAIFQKVDHQWVASALPWRRNCSIWPASACARLSTMARHIPVRRGTVAPPGHRSMDLAHRAVDPVASLDAAVFYANRALCSADQFYGYAGAALLALLIGQNTHEPYRCVHGSP